MGDGLFECILGRWSDLRAGADFDGKDEADAGADYGAFGLLRRFAPAAPRLLVYSQNQSM